VYSDDDIDENGLPKSPKRRRADTGVVDSPSTKCESFALHFANLCLLTYSSTAPDGVIRQLFAEIRNKSLSIAEVAARVQVISNAPFKAGRPSIFVVAFMDIFEVSSAQFALMKAGKPSGHVVPHPSVLYSRIGVWLASSREKLTAL
jgi:hypothetical protein